ncbi:MAG: LemA family protein [Candidatus Muproteobacteria bacterium RIFCSPHIGHO2_02_FULL_65_16]|uniref:LemA family protein n=1 Tax=Candidatus Muproteobacteria bacterium RIFCSPHIGHO2_02_FULL_65_16 TaxID=1817766 RepID=A0A1F6TWH5_9PROT|nr:MAG: LemA family protein [Candidatus Muproteobacteria bacterium RIFCSPHIGHO2_02_FULL_65_16]
MAVTIFVITGVVLALVLYIILIYNNFVRLKHNVSQAWSNIDVLLKQRHDELPKLVETCKQYMKHEREVLEKVTQARAAVGKAREAGDVAALGAAETRMRVGLANLFAVAENYPELRANENFQHLQNRISQLEAQIADRREYYNDSVNINNVRVEQFPDGVVARLFRFGLRPLLTFEESELKDVNVKALFNS